MKINPQILRSHPLLSLIPFFSARKLISESAFSEYPKGTVVYRQGDPCDAIYLIISGRCESRRSDGNGGEDIEEVSGPGDTLGDSEFLNQEPYRSTVKVVTDSVMLRLSGAELHELFKRKPSFAGRFSQTVINRLKLHRQTRDDYPTRVRRVVSLISLAARSDDGIVARQLAAALHEVSHHDVLLVNLEPTTERVALKDWDAIAPKLNGRFCYRDELRKSDKGYFELRMSVSGDEREPAYMAPMLSHFGQHFEYVILRVSPRISTPSSLECMVQSDLTFVILEPTSENLYEFQLLLKQLREKNHGDGSQIKPILYLEQDLPATEFSDALKHIGHPVHSFVRGFPLAGTTGGIARAGNFPMHIRSLAREIGRCRVGLALSSGGAKGLAHIGVIQILEENGIEVDIVAGSSMGAYVGSVWCSGFDGQACEKIARETEQPWGLLKLIEPSLPPRQGFLKSGRVVKRLRRSIGEARFSDLSRPLRVVATYLDTLERAVFSSGEVARAVGASIAIPGICVPVTLDGETFIDGGIADPLPVDVLREMGIERVIAVNTIPTPERLRYCSNLEKEQNYGLPQAFRFPKFLNRHLNYFADGNILDIMLRSIHGAQTRVAEMSGREADLVLRPLACDVKWHDFTHPRKYIALGRQAAEDLLPELKTLAKVEVHDSTRIPVAIPGK
ncbi:MAG TPA: cyclic nucleotide-binding and patatin-like phospholipase domain-containing protein [Chthoniobacteraceae bacterium]|nr:cyclic nucleotide-binding and patatin-like phospholipase domain-containing protein [Chthoniobacteraceae bacterium]